MQNMNFAWNYKKKIKKLIKKNIKKLIQQRYCGLVERKKSNSFGQI